MIVLHCTELPSLDIAREYGEKVLYDDGTGNSGHYYIDRDGKIDQYVPDDRVARHVVGFNKNSIGIEIVNLGRYPNWYQSQHQTFTEPYTDAQIQSVKDLLRHLKEKYPAIAAIKRHSDLDTRLVPSEDNPEIQIHRKIDPGPMFPWDEIQDFWSKL
jgi:N-acetylmuramoyl-L-alanine amidase